MTDPDSPAGADPQTVQHAGTLAMGALARGAGRGTARKRGDAPLRRLGRPRDRWRDLFYFLMVQPWWRFYLLLIGIYLLLNSGFATLYWLHPGAIAEPNPGRWLDDFFFSFETLATVGFGVEHPETAFAHWVVTAEILTSVLIVPLATGLIVVKFARPTARVVFSRNAIIAPFEGVPTLMFRLANTRANQIYEARINLTMLRRERLEDGGQFRRLVDLPTLRDTHPLFFLSWTVMHRIDAASPLYGLDWAALPTGAVQFLAVLSGLDDTTAAPVHARWMYDSDDVLHDHRFEDIVSASDDGEITIDYNQLHAVRPHPTA